MAFSDNIDAIKGYATNAAQTAVKKTKMLASVAKANITILAEEEKIKKAQLELGKIYYKDFILDEEPDQAEYLPLCDKITESLKLIDNLKLEIAMAREEVEVEEPAAAEAEAEPVVEEVAVDFSGDNVPSVSVTVTPGSTNTGSADASDVLELLKQKDWVE